MVSSKAKITVLRSKVTSRALQVTDLVGQIARLRKSLKLKSRSAVRARFKWLQLKNKGRDQKVKLIHNEVTKKRAAVKRRKNQAGDALISEIPCKRRRTSLKTETSFWELGSETLADSWDEPKIVLDLRSKVPAVQVQGVTAIASIHSYTQPRTHQTRTSSDFSGLCRMSGFPAAYNARQETTDPRLQTSWACRSPALSTTSCYPNVVPSYIDQLVTHSYTHSPDPPFTSYHAHTHAPHSSTLYAHLSTTHSPQTLPHLNVTPTISHYSSQTPNYSSLPRIQNQEPSSPVFQPAYPSHSHTGSSRPPSSLDFPVHYQLCPLSCNNSRNKSIDSSITVNEEIISPLSSPRILPVTNIQIRRNHILPNQTLGDATSSHRLAELEAQACSNIGQSSPFPLHVQQRFYEHPGLCKAHVLDPSLYWPHEEVKDDRPVFKARDVLSRSRRDSRAKASNVLSPSRCDSHVSASSWLSPSRLYSHVSTSYVMSPSDRDLHAASSIGLSPSRRDSHVTASNGLSPSRRDSHVTASNGLSPSRRDSHISASYVLSPSRRDLHVASSNGLSSSRRDSNVTANNVLCPSGRDSLVSASKTLSPPGRESHVKKSNKVFYKSSPDPHVTPSKVFYTSSPEPHVTHSKVFYTSSPDPYVRASNSGYTPGRSPHINSKSTLHKNTAKVKACVSPFHIYETSPSCAMNKDKTFAFASAATICQESIQEESLSGGLSRWLKSMTREGADYSHPLNSFSNVLTETEPHMELDESCELLYQSILPSENPSSFTQFQSCFLRHLDQDELQQQYQGMLQNQHYLFMESSEHNCRQKHSETSFAPHLSVKKHRRHRHSLCIPPSELPFPPLSPFHHPSTTQLQRTSAETTLSELLNQSLAQSGPQCFFSVENLHLCQEDGNPVPSPPHLEQYSPYFSTFSHNTEGYDDHHYLLDNILTEQQEAASCHYHLDNILNEQEEAASALRDLDCVSLVDIHVDKRQIEATVPCQGENEI